MITLSDKFKKAFTNIHNRFVETDVAISDKADKATTLEGYGITDGCTQKEAFSMFSQNENDIMNLTHRVDNIEIIDIPSKADKSDLDSIKNILNKNFELIATQTVSPDTDGSLPNAIEFSVDDNGEPFELTDFFIIAKTGVNGSSTVRLLVNDHGIWGNASIEGFNQATATRLWNIQYISFGEDNGGVVFCSRQTSLISHPNSNIYTDYVVRIPPKLLFSNVSHINSIKKIQLGLTTTTATFTEGSTFELWGVKKK